MAKLTFKETKQRNGYNTGQRHWLIRVPSGWTNDGFVTIGKVAHARQFRFDQPGTDYPGNRYMPQGWCLQLNSDTDLTIDELQQVVRFMDEVVVTRRQP